MKPIDPEFAARLMTSHAQVLRALSEAMTMDLAVAPVTVTTPVGYGTVTLCTTLASALSCRQATVLRCSMFTAEDIEPYWVVNGGEIEQRPPRVRAAVPTDFDAPHFVVLDEAGEAAPGMIAAALRVISDAATSPIVVILIGQGDSEEAMLAEIADGLDLHRAHVPGARISADPLTPMPAQPVLVAGSASFEGSKRGERHLSIDIDAPYPHQVNVTLIADEGMDEDALSDLTSELINAPGSVFLRLDSDGSGSYDIGPADITLA